MAATVLAMAGGTSPVCAQPYPMPRETNRSMPAVSDAGKSTGFGMPGRTLGLGTICDDCEVAKYASDCVGRLEGPNFDADGNRSRVRTQYRRSTTPRASRPLVSTDTRTRRAYRTVVNLANEGPNLQPTAAGADRCAGGHGSCLGQARRSRVRHICGSFVVGDRVGLSRSGGRSGGRSGIIHQSIHSFARDGCQPDKHPAAIGWIWEAVYELVLLQNDEPAQNSGAWNPRNGPEG